MASGHEEDDALLTGQSTNKSADAPVLIKSRWREIGVFVWALLATAAVLVLAVVYQHSRSEQGGESGHSRHEIPSGKRNLIFMVSDGMGPTSLSMTRSWRQYTEHLPYDETLVLDQHLIGQSRTRSTNSLVTDSAAGATAFSCGMKSYNGAISVTPAHEPCGSVMEAAKRLGYTTALVVTTAMTDATPAVFAAHARRREMEDQIALQMIGDTHPLGRMVDLMFGGGRCHFLPSNATEGSCRDDVVDVVQKAQEHGWNYISSRDEFDKLETSVKLPLLGLFATGDIPYEIDRRSQSDVYPSLEEMAKTALNVLSAASKDQEQGFFIMIEGSRIDHAGHGNDPAAQVHEVLAFDKAMAAVLNFIENDSKGVPTLLVSTSDHETGGLAAARQLTAAYPRYHWFPDVLANASHSASWASSTWRAHQNSNADVEVEQQFLTSLLSKSLGINDASQEELDSLSKEGAIPSYIFADMISRRAQIGWSSHGHSAADVNIYSSDRNVAADLVGSHENTDVGAFLSKYLGVEDELRNVTEQLKEYMKTTSDEWLGLVQNARPPIDHLDHFHGDHRKRCDACDV